MKTRIDYLSFTFPKTFSEAHHESIRSRIDHFLSFVSLSVGVFSPPRNFYSYTYTIIDLWGRDVGFIAWGGNGGTINVNISGVGCSMLSRVSYFVIKQWIDSFDAKITRCDVCYDFDGSFDSEYRKAEAGLYDGVDSLGRSHARKLSLVSDLGSGDGSTLYIGSRGSATYTRIYEKGKQLGDKSSSWVRVETEFRSVDTNIISDILVNPDLYFAAVSYRHAFLIEVHPSSAKRFNPRKRSLIAASSTIIENIRLQYGQHIHLLRGLHSDSDLLDLLEREGIPARLKKL